MRLYAMICGRVRCRQAIFLPEAEKDRYVDMPMPGHSPGHQILRVKLEKQGVVILSGDSVPFRENYGYIRNSQLVNNL
jgi:glyoxylase-like metal-dependent hydrolase (beta-lactamase superfamily II)